MAPRAAIIGLQGLEVSPAERRFLAEADPWGLILFARNVGDPDQLRALTSQARDALGRAAPILIDQEGGRVARMGRPHWRTFLPALDQMARAQDPLRAQYLRHRLIASDLHAAGIDVDCAPLADLVEDGTHPVLRNRLYGSQVDSVVAAARAGADGLLAGGVLPVLKHIPGYGRATVDGHRDLPVVSVPLEDLRARDFAPFGALSDMAMGMTAHVLYPAIDPERAATVSPAVIEVVRREIGFDGLLMTDDLGMEALSGTPGARTAAALAAGCDIALFGNGGRGEIAEVMANAPPLSGKALGRAERALAQRRPPDPVDIAAMEAELDALLK